MKIKILLVTLLAITNAPAVRAQLNVGGTAAPDPSAMLQVTGTLRGFLPPVVTKAQRDGILVPAAGLVVFNSTSNQLEVNTGTTTLPIWTSTTGGGTTVIVSQPVDVSRLGYSPSSSATAASASASFSITTNGHTTTYTKSNTFSSSVTNHSYAVYQVSAGYNPGWFDAYNAAKSLGGYLGTFTSFAEWNSVYVGLLQNVTANPTMWIGMAKMSWRAGSAMTADVIDWITGEHSSLDYSGTGNANIWTYNNFNSGEPNNTSSNEGFIQVLSGTSTGLYSTGSGTVGTAYAWNDLPSANQLPGFVIEFNQ